MLRWFSRTVFLAVATLLLVGCPFLESTTSAAGDDEKAVSGRLVMFIGVDISGSFRSKPYFSSSLDFLAHYIYAHLKGLGGLEVPHSLFVGSIGGAKPDEPKTFQPIETFQYQEVPGIRAELERAFNSGKVNPNTDYNAFFLQVKELAENRKLVLRPISILMLSDGVPDVTSKDGKKGFESITLSPLETLARNITLRLIYTTADVGANWQTRIKRQRVKVWTQDAEIMQKWHDKSIFLEGKPLGEQDRLLSWIKDLVDFNPRRRRVD